MLDSVRRGDESLVPPTSLLATLSPGTPVSVSSVPLLSKTVPSKALEIPSHCE